MVLSLLYLRVGAFMGGAKHILVLMAVGLSLGLAMTTPARAGSLNYGDEPASYQRVANKILKLLGTSELTVGQVSPNGNQTDSNSKNPYGSNTTYHSRVYPICLAWVTTTLCERWLDPYVSEHGLGQGKNADPNQSPLEGSMAGMWERLKKDIDANQVGPGQQIQYGIWSVTGRGDKPLLRTRDTVRRQTLDTEAISDWRLLPQVEKVASQIGTNTADRAIQNVLEGAAKDGKTMPNLETLRVMALTWTRALRNRLVANLGEARAAQEGIEFELSEADPDCDAILGKGEAYDRNERESGYIPLPLRALETRVNQDIQKRYALCQQAREMPIYAVNPDVKGENLAPGDPKREAYDAAVNRINIALIDYAGKDPNTMTKPEGVNFSVDDYSVELTEYQPGGQEFTKYMRTNAETLESYNAQLREAAARWRAASSYAPDYIKAGVGSTIEGYQIARESKNLMQINGLSESQKIDGLDKTSITAQPVYVQSGVFSANPDDASIEDRPSRLTITNLGGR